MTNTTKNTWEKGIDYPEWFSQEAMKVVKKGYLNKGEVPTTMYQRIIDTTLRYYEPILPGKEFANLKMALTASIMNGWLSPATPVASNFGSPKNSPVSCFTVHPENSINSIFGKLHECAMLSKYGGGLGCYLGDIEGSTPLHHWGKMFDEMANKVSQSGTRRGSVALYFDITHKDFYAMMEAKDKVAGDIREKLDCNIAVTIKNDFMQDVVKFLEGDSSPGVRESFDRFTKAIDTRLHAGTPYMTFIDNVNQQKPDCYKARNMDISSSNLCLTGDTLVLTKKGYIPISTLANECQEGGSVEIWDGERWVENSNFKYMGQDTVYEVHLNSGYSYKATGYHGWFVSNGSLRRPDMAEQNADRSKYKKLTTCELEPGMVLEGYGAEIKHKQVGQDFGDSYRIVTRNIDYLETCGLLHPLNLQATYQDRAMLAVALIERFGSKNWDDQFAIIKYQDVPKQVQSMARLLRQTFELFRSLGINAEIRGDAVGMPASDLKDLVEVYIKPETFSPNLVEQLKAYPYKFKSGRSLKQGRSIESIVELPYKEHVYCTQVPSTGKFALAGDVMTSNCNEIFQYTDALHTFICVLSSINAGKYDDWKDVKIGGFTPIKCGIYMLEAVVAEYIEKCKELINGEKKMTSLENALRSAIKGRALGLGTLGLHALYMKRKYPFASQEARNLNIEIHKRLREESLEASLELGSLLGECEWSEGTGRRHTVLNAIAPTTSNSILCNGITPGIEPIHGQIYTKIGAKSTETRYNPIFLEILEKYGKNTKEVHDKVIADGGSVQGLDFLSDEEKEYLKIFREIDPFEIIKQASDRQVFIDQGQSLNVFLPYDTSRELLVALHVFAWQKGLKGLYYVRSSSVTKDLTKSSLFSQSDTTVDGTMNATIYTRKDCPYCDWAKQLLDIRRVKYTEVEQPTGTVPQIYVNNEFIGGCTELYDFYDTKYPWDEDEDCVGCSG